MSSKTKKIAYTSKTKSKIQELRKNLSIKDRKEYYKKILKKAENDQEFVDQTIVRFLDKFFKNDCIEVYPRALWVSVKDKLAKNPEDKYFRDWMNYLSSTIKLESIPNHDVQVRNYNDSFF